MKKGKILLNSAWFPADLEVDYKRFNDFHCVVTDSLIARRHDLVAADIYLPTKLQGLRIKIQGSSHFDVEKLKRQIEDLSIKLLEKLDEIESLKVNSQCHESEIELLNTKLTKLNSIFLKVKTKRQSGEIKENVENLKRHLKYLEQKLYNTVKSMKEGHILVEFQQRSQTCLKTVQFKKTRCQKSIRVDQLLKKSYLSLNGIKVGDVVLKINDEYVIDEDSVTVYEKFQNLTFPSSVTFLRRERRHTPKKTILEERFTPIDTNKMIDKQKAASCMICDQSLRGFAVKKVNCHSCGRVVCDRCHRSYKNFTICNPCYSSKFENRRASSQCSNLSLPSIRSNFSPKILLKKEKSKEMRNDVRPLKSLIIKRKLSTN